MQLDHVSASRALVEPVHILRDQRHRSIRSQRGVKARERDVRRVGGGSLRRAMRSSKELPHPGRVPREYRGIGMLPGLAVLPQPAGAAKGRQPGRDRDPCTREHDDAPEVVGIDVGARRVHGAPRARSGNGASMGEGRASRVSSHSAGSPAAPTLPARMPPTMAQVVSRSPRPATVCHMARS